MKGSNLGSLSPMFVKEEDLKLPKTASIGIQVTPPKSPDAGKEPRPLPEDLTAEHSETSISLRCRR